MVTLVLLPRVNEVVEYVLMLKDGKENNFFFIFIDGSALFANPKTAAGRSVALVQQYSRWLVGNVWFVSVFPNGIFILQKNILIILIGFSFPYGCGSILDEALNTPTTVKQQPHSTIKTFYDACYGKLNTVIQLLLNSPCIATA